MHYFFKVTTLFQHICLSYFIPCKTEWADLKSIYEGNIKYEKLKINFVKRYF